MKKGTLVLMGNLDAENFCRKFMLDGAMNGGLGVAAASLPRHISLGMPYEIKDYDAYLAYAEKLAKEIKPMTVKLTAMASAAMGPTGNYVFRFEETGEPILDGLREKVRKALMDDLDLEIPEKDGVTGSKNITLGFGTAPYEAYKAYVDGVDPATFVGQELTFDELGVFYYDQPTISASTFCCVKRIKL